MATIRNDQHVFIAGMTGSGKTFLSKVYLAGNDKQVFALDSKGTFEWEQIPEKLITLITHLSELPAAAQKYKYVVYRPVSEELDFEFYNAFFKFCYDLRNCTVYVDEAAQICPSPTKIPDGYKSILTRGRELNVNVWSATQRPANLPILIYSEASHWFIFKLNAVQDRKKLVEFSGYEEFNDILPEHVFNYFNAVTGKPPKKGKLGKGGKAQYV